MVADILGHDDDYLTLPAVLAAAARRATDAQVVVYAMAGVVIVVCALVFRPAAWMAFTGFGLCTGAFGGWAIAERELRDRRDRPDAPRAVAVAWKAAQVVAAVLGTCGGVMLLFQMLAVGLGTWRS